MKILVKNMVCRHCVEKVEEIAASIPALADARVSLGSIETAAEPTPDTMQALTAALADNGFEIILSREAEIVERIKRELIDVSRRDPVGHPNLTEILPELLNTGYRTLGRIFAEAEGRSIENYFMALKTERVKELLHYGRMTLDEIAYTTGFSSAAHLSRQFKQLTGLTPGQFRAMGSRKPLPEV